MVLWTTSRIGRVLDELEVAKTWVVLSLVQINSVLLLFVQY